MSVSIPKRCLTAAQIAKILEAGAVYGICVEDDGDDLYIKHLSIGEARKLAKGFIEYWGLSYQTGQKGGTTNGNH